MDYAKNENNENPNSESLFLLSEIELSWDIFTLYWSIYEHDSKSF